MVTVKPNFYELKQELSETQLKSMLNFLDYRSNDPCFLQMVKEHHRYAPVLYRGIHYPLKKLEIGMSYSHFESLSSWSTEFDVARTFNLDTDLSEGFIEDMILEMGFDLMDTEAFSKNWEKAVNQFVEVVFKVKSQRGFPVNDFIDHPLYSSEKEFVLHNGIWTIVDVAETYDVQGRRFYLVELA